MVNLNFNSNNNSSGQDSETASEATENELNEFIEESNLNFESINAEKLDVNSNLPLKTQILKASSINIERANSLLLVADLAMKEITDILKRQSALARKARSKSINLATRNDLQDEFSHLENEINRITDNTCFNNVKLINGEFGHSLYKEVQNTKFSDSNYPEKTGNLEVTDSNGSIIGGLHDSQIRTYKGVITGAIEDISVTYDKKAGETTFNFQIGGKSFSATEDFYYNIFKATGTDVNLKDKTGANILKFKYQNNITGPDMDMHISSDDKATALQTALKNAFKFGKHFKVGTNNEDNITIEINNVTTTPLYKEKILDISKSPEDAKIAKETVDNAINILYSARANISALRSRFNYTSNIVDTAFINRNASKTRISYANIKQPQAKCHYAQVKALPNISMLAQAYNLPQQLLSLVKK